MRGVGILVLVALLTACSGGSGDDTPEPSETSAGLPTCSQVWVDGTVLPANYLGCTNEDGTIEGEASVECESGSGRFVTYQDRFFALAGGQITEASTDSDAYATAYHECHVGS